MSLAISIAFSSPSHGMIETTGPKISSCAMRILGSTSANTVGATNQPWLYASPSRRCPPHNIFAPSSLPILMYFRSVSIWLELMAGPMSTLSSRPLPTFSFLACATSSSTNFLYTPFCSALKRRAEWADQLREIIQAYRRSFPIVASSEADLEQALLVHHPHNVPFLYSMAVAF